MWASRRSLLGILFLLAAISVAAPADAQQAQRRDSRRLTNAELVQANISDTFDAVRALRPHWLNPRGQSSMRGQTSIKLFVDGVPRGSVEALRSLPIHNIAQIQYYNSSEATQRWGTDHAAGALVVKTM